MSDPWALLPVSVMAGVIVAAVIGLWRGGWRWIIRKWNDWRRPYIPKDLKRKFLQVGDEIVASNNKSIVHKVEPSEIELMEELGKTHRDMLTWDNVKPILGGGTFYFSVRFTYKGKPLYDKLKRRQPR